jgi:hypothetical protein
MAKIRELTSPNGWPASEDRKALGIESFTVPGTKIRFACAKAVAPLLVNFAKEFHELVEPIKHPLGKSNTFNKDQRNTINLLITKYGLTWGGNYKRRKDDMHFEIALDRDEVKQKIEQLGLK